MIRFITIAALIAFAPNLGITSGCTEGRYFPDESATRAHLAANRQLFTKMAEEWLRGKGDGMFCYFGEGDLRWGDTFIKKSGFGYDIIRPPNRTIHTNTLDEAAAAAGVTPSTLTHWITLAQQAKVYSITAWPWGEPDAPHSVDIQLWGSDYNGYGLRYVPQGNKDRLAELAEEIQRQSFSLEDGETSHIDGPWYYFEGVR